MVRSAEGAIRPPDPDPLVCQYLKSLKRAVMDEVTVYIQKRLAVAALPDRVSSPYIVDEALRMVLLHAATVLWIRLRYSEVI
jgi:hypothetical protein